MPYSELMLHYTCITRTQEPAFQGGLVAALIALADLQKLDSHSSQSGPAICHFLGVSMELVVESRALKARDNTFPTFCLETLKQCLDNCSPGRTEPNGYLHAHLPQQL